LDGCSGDGPTHSKLDFFDDFELEQPEWDLENGWAIEDVEGNNVLRGLGHSFAQLNYNKLNSFAFKAKFKRQKGGIHFNFRRNGLPDGLHRYYVSVRENGLALNKQLGENSFHVLAKPSGNLDFSKWHWIEIKADGADIRVFIDGKLCICYKDSDPITTGNIGLEALPNSDYLIDQVSIFD
jgi:hypothetical protein